MTEKTMAVDGLMVRWEEGGEPDGTPTVLVHGLPTTPRLWRHVVPRLEGARILAWELVGYGGSIPLGKDRDISLSAQADYLAGTLVTAGIRRAVVAGHDIGGGIAQILAVRRPDLVQGVVLIDSVALDSWPTSGVKVLRALAPVIRHLPNAAIKTIVRGMIRRGHSEAFGAAESFAEHWPFYERTDAGAALVRQIEAFDVKDTMQIASQLRSLDIPSRLVWGAGDPFQPIDYAHRLSTLLRAPLDAVDGAKHFIPEDYADRAAAAINSLLRELSAPGARPSRKHARHSEEREGAQAELPPRGAPGARTPNREAPSSQEERPR